MTASFTEDMVMVITEPAELVSKSGATDNLENDLQGFKKIKGSVNGGETDLSMLLHEPLVEFLGAQGHFGSRKLLVN